MNARTSSLAERTVFAALVAAAFVPLAVLPGLGHPFLTGRELLLRVVVAVVLPAAAWAFGIRRIVPKTPLAWATWAITAIATLSTAFSIDPSTSFWGFPERFGGLVSVFCYVAIGVALAFAVRDTRRRAVFLWVSGLVWMTVSLLAVYERTLVGPWIQFHSAHGRVISTVGNPIFLAAATIAAVAVYLPALLSRKRTALRDAGVVAASALAIAVVIFTETRGAWIGLLVGAAVGVFAYALMSRSRAAKVAVTAFAALSIVSVAALAMAKDSPFVRGNVLLDRAASVFRSGEASAVQRIQLWRIAARAIAERPIFGWGLENFDYALDRDYDPSFTIYGTANSYSDRAHDAYLDVAVTAGIPGLLAYIGLFAAISVGVVEARKRGVLSEGAAAVALGGIAAYLAQGAFSFESQVTMITLAVSAGLVASLRVSEDDDAMPRIRVPRTIVAGVASIVSLGLIVRGVVPLYRGSIAVHESTLATSIVDLKDAADGVSVPGNPYRAAEEHRVANDIFKAIGGKKDWDAETAALSGQVLSLLEDAVTRSPGKYAYRFTLANVTLVRAVHGLSGYDEAAAAFEAARPFAPERQMTDYQLGNLELLRGDPAKALERFRAAYDLAPEVPESHWHLARGLAATGDLTAAAEEFATAIGDGFVNDRTPQEYSVAIGALLGDGKFDMIRLVYRAWTRVSPDDPDVLAGLATVDAELGLKAESLAAVKRGLELDSTLGSEVPAFLEEHGYSQADLDSADITALNLQSDD